MSLYEDFLKIVSKYSDSPAIKSFDGKTIYYHELEKDVDLFVKYIVSELGDEEYIGIVDDQNYLAIVSIIATIFAGKNIILVDPRLGRKRISGLLLKYTRFYFSGLYKNIEGLELIRYSNVKKTNGQPDKNKVPDNGGYVIFTSGSTGEPKAVSANSQALARLAKTLIKKYYVEHKSNVVQFAYLGFDSALAEIWITLLSGATLLIPGKELREKPYQCLRIMSKYKNNIITLPPSFAKNIDDSILDHITTLILAGEECPVALANRCRKKVRHLINAYGPTESIICASTYEIIDEQEVRVPIGFPIDGVQIRLSDNNEILINSKQLFNGYLGVASDNCIKLHGKRWFNSGDIGRIHKNGVIEYLGRKDNQIKINGQRIEIEGLEAELREFLNMEELFIVPKKYNDELILTVVTDNKSDYERIKKANLLSAYKLLPWEVIVISSLPRNQNGKIDRKQLALKIKNNSDVDLTSISYMDNKDGELLKIWQEIFGAAPKNIEIGFFAAGGDSLRALKLIKALDDGFGLKIKLTDILRNDYSFSDLKKIIGDKV